MSDTVLRVGDVIQAFAPGDFELLRGRGPRDVWLCTTFPIGYRFGPYTNEPWRAEAADGVPFDHHVPADFAERAAMDGRIVYPVDAWSTWSC